MKMITTKEFDNLAAYIKMKFGISLGAEKKNMLENRLYKLWAENNFTDANEYYQHLLSDQTGKSDIALANAITTNHTFFMREAEHFSYFSQTVLPYLASKIVDNDLRSWCAACSTGEEAYTLEMLMYDFFSLKNKKWDIKLLATDLSVMALKTAQQGIYKKTAVAALPDKWQKTYFRQFDKQHYQVNAFLKNQVIFRQFNLMYTQFPFKRKFHIIFCRNVMIYFDRETRKRLVRQFYHWLEPGGYLFIGQSEVIETEQSLFQYIMPSVYRKGL